MAMSNGGDAAALEKELTTCRNLNASLREQLDQAHSENTSLTDQNKIVRKKVLSLQQEIGNHNNNYSRLESEMFQQGQEVERLKKENVGFLKNKREIERKLREETVAFENDRSSWQDREAELVSQVKALQETVNVLAQQNEQASHKKSSESNNDEPSNSGSNSPSSASVELAAYTSSREVKQAQQKIKEQDQLIKQLRDDVYKSNKEVTETTTVTKTHLRRIQQLETELNQVKDQNSSLMEENESFQVLLHEKTIKGEFVLNPILQHDSRDRRFAKPTSPDAIKPTGDLAAELDRANGQLGQIGERVQKESERNDEIEKLQDQVKSLEKDNKSLNLYIQKILNRIMEVQGFEQLLSTDWSKQTFESNPSTPTVTTFGHARTQSTAAVAVTPTEPVKKIERRKTLSGPPQRPQIKILPKTPIDEQEDQLSPLPLSPTARAPSAIPEEGPIPRLADPPKHRRRNSQSGPPEPKKRWSLFGGWGANAAKEEKKEDPHLKPMLLLQDKGRANA